MFDLAVFLALLPQAGVSGFPKGPEWKRGRISTAAGELRDHPLTDDVQKYAFVTFTWAVSRLHKETCKVL